jgi:hypothetical protein
VLTPLRNMIPRVSGKGGIQAAWRAITAINTTGLRFGVSSANRGGVMAVATKDYTATYKGIGVETSVDFEAQYAGQEFDDVRAVGAKTGLEALMLGEEAMILGGSISIPLGTTPTPTLTALTTGGTLAAQTWSVICAAMTLDALMNGSIAGGVQGSITRPNADGLTSDTFGGGVAKKSANATVATTGATGSIAASVAPVSGALGYAWFWGAAGAEKLGAITTINSVVVIAAATGTQLASDPNANLAADNSTNALPTFFMASRPRPVNLRPLSLKPVRSPPQRHLRTPLPMPRPSWTMMARSMQRPACRSQRFLRRPRSGNIRFRLRLEFILLIQPTPARPS